MNAASASIQEHQMKSSLPITEEEKQQVREVLSAAMSENWELFKTLSDGGFEDEDAMRQDFLGGSEQLRNLPELRVDMGAAEQEDRSRITVVEISSAETSTSPVVLTLYKRSPKEARFKIWTFHVRPAWLNFR